MYEYDSNSNVTAYQLVNAGKTENVVEYTYDKINRITGVSTNGLTEEYTYNHHGFLSGKKTGDMETIITRNQCGLPTKYETMLGDEIISSYEYTYRLDGNRITETDTLNNIHKEYEYDDVGRLKKETITGTENRTTEYEYDLKGNRTKKYLTIDGTNYVTESEYDGNNCITWQFGRVNGNEDVTAQYMYDSNGNLTNKVISANDRTEEIYIYIYNLQNKLTGYTNGEITASYEYGANGLRKNKTVNGTTTDFVWNGDNLIKETVNAVQSNFYAYGIEGIIAKEKTSEIARYLKNAHGDITGIVSADETTFSNYMYDAFGNLIYESEQPTPFGYCGEYRDEESGLIYLRNRYYDSNTGRFITEDPIQDGTNWYVYCENNPVGFVDPLGLFEEEDWKLTAPHVAEVLLYTMQYYGAAHIGDSYTMDYASNAAEWLRNNDEKNNEHAALKRVMESLDRMGAEVSNWGVFINELTIVQSRLGSFSDEGNSTIAESLFGKFFGSVISTLVPNNIITPNEEYADYKDTLDEFLDKQKNIGGFIDIDVITFANEYGEPDGYVQVIYENIYEGIEIRRNFFEQSFELTLISNLWV